MKTDLKEFMNYITIIDKEFSIYKDTDKGITFPYNTVGLLVKVECLELDKNEYQMSLFHQQIEDLKYNVINIKRPIPKNEITKDEKDKFTIVEKEISVRQLWKVSNSIGVYKCFTNKDEAMKYAEEINCNIFKYL